MAAYNLVVLVGNLTRSPELSYTPNQNEVCKFGLAVNEKYKDKETVTFVECEAWNKTAVNINKYLTKGSPVFVSGKLNFQSWADKDTGKKRSKIGVTVLNCQFLDSRDTGQAKQEPKPDTPDDDIRF